MTERIRFRCPYCGMIADEDRLNSKHKIQVFAQEFGGKVQGEIKGRGKAKGYIKYTDVTKKRGDIVREIKERIKLMSD